jgi:hypothetical protein
MAPFMYCMYPCIYVAYAGPYLQGVDRCESAAEDSSLHLQLAVKYNVLKVLSREMDPTEIRLIG